MNALHQPLKAEHCLSRRFAVEPECRITYHDTSIKNPVTGRWRRGPLLKRIAIVVIVEGITITLASVDQQVNA